jgi:RNA polymerase sigma-70 factor (ECF subfamily)
MTAAADPPKDRQIEDCALPSGGTEPEGDPTVLRVLAPEGESDPTLMKRIREGDRIAYRILVERYWVSLASYAASTVGLSDGGEDVAQEVFIRVWRHRAAWTPRGSVGAYLYRITRNLALNALRASAAETRRRRAAGNHLPFSAVAKGPEEELALKTLRNEILSAISSLPPRRREVFVLSRFHGLTYMEIGETMGISPQTVANQMASALAELRRILAGHLKET